MINTDEICDSQEFEDEANRIFKERMEDYDGWFLDSFTQASDEELAYLSKLIVESRNAPLDKTSDYQRSISDAVYKLVTNYCEPDDTEVLEFLNNGRND